MRPFPRARSQSGGRTPSVLEKAPLDLALICVQGVNSESQPEQALSWLTPKLEGTPAGLTARPCSRSFWGPCGKLPVATWKASGRESDVAWGRAGGSGLWSASVGTSPRPPAVLPPPALGLWPPEALKPLPSLWFRSEEFVPDGAESSGAQLHHKELPGGSPHLQGRGGEGQSLPAPG